MEHTAEQRKAFFWSTFIGILTLVPYGLAYILSSKDQIFSGFLINPLDGFSYLAKMRQGYDGAWLFRLPYTHQPGAGSWLFLFHILLGKLARGFQLPLIAVYHGARFVGAVAMFFLSYQLYKRIFSDKYLRWTAFIFSLVGSGLGWLLLPTGIMTADLWIPEAIPFLSAYANAHFPWAAALILLLVLTIVFSERTVGHRAGVAFLGGVLLAIIQPFSIISLSILLLGWFVWEFLRSNKERTLRDWLRSERGRLTASGAMLVGSIPWLSYDFWLSRSHPILSVWNAQNRTPSPPIHEFLIGYGLVFLLALAAILIAQAYRTSKARFLIAWAMIQGVFLYAPIALQRRFALGLFFPLAGLAALGVQRLFRGQQTFRVAMILLLLLSIPSNLLVMISGIYGALQGDSAIMLQKEEKAAYQWLSDHSASGDLILAGPRTGNRIPAFGPQRVLYGHPFETPSAEQMRSLVEGFYREAEGVVDSLADLGVVYVMYGPEEQALGKAPWLRELNLVFVRGEYQIFELMNP